MIYSSMEQLIGHTPLVRLGRLEAHFALGAELFVKLECFNPGGSAKDRVGLSMLDDAERRGVLQPGGVIIEPTSGNTGIGLAAVAAARGYRAIIVMPDSMSVERIRLMRAYGAQVVLSPGAEGMAGAIALAQSLQSRTPNSFIAGQFENPANALAHYTSTGPELLGDTEGRLDAFVATVGTGGTITGTGRYLKEHLPSIHIAAVEPAGSPVLSGGQPGPHKLQGIGAGFVPAVLDTGVYDEVLTVSDEDAFSYARLLAQKEGLLCGISSGACLCAAVTLAQRPDFAGKRIAALLTDTGERYLSSGLFGED